MSQLTVRGLLAVVQASKAVGENEAEKATCEEGLKTPVAEGKV